MRNRWVVARAEDMAGWEAVRVALGVTQGTCGDRSAAGSVYLTLVYSLQDVTGGGKGGKDTWHRLFLKTACESAIISK